MPQWLTIVLSLGGTAIISSVMGYMVTRFLNKAFKDRDEVIKERAAQEEERKRRDMEEKQKLEEFIRQNEREERKADTRSLLVPIEGKLDALDKKLRADSEGTLCSLRSDILGCYYRCNDKGYRNDYDYQNIHDLYEAYTNLGGNSFVADVIRRFDDLPTKEVLRREGEK